MRTRRHTEANVKSTRLGATAQATVARFSAKRNDLSARIRLVTSGQQALARNVVEFEPDPVGILEQQRIVSRRPLILARGADDLRIERADKAVEFVDIGALTRAKAKVVQTDALLLESGSRKLRRRCADSDRGAAADAIIEAVSFDHRLHAEEGQQLAIELPRA